ncbi:helix-turn-helix transcriptional regulator [Azospira inquinata]|uniref:Helix-turn-helix transcriptional regulator n=2 Tax=Azospira inquinata TaxID=2785627 RepID=A0A975XW38_9RHOO|nr:helix-turn-helix transcriptional regulator [Azospira inquinata]QWT50492.1 helix-turn-helix transcriptional regulator [Azospira inquinata]
MKKKFALTEIREYRKALGMSQLDFWGQLGTTQSAGSRYESGRNIPQTMAILLLLLANGKISDADLTETLAAAKKQLKERI